MIVEFTTTRGTVLKGHSIGKVENSVLENAGRAPSFHLPIFTWCIEGNGRRHTRYGYEESKAVVLGKVPTGCDLLKLSP